MLEFENEVGYLSPVSAIAGIGNASPTTERTTALFILIGGIFMSFAPASSLAVGQETFGSAVLCGGLATCSTAIFRLQAESGEDLLHRGGVA